MYNVGMKETLPNVGNKLEEKIQNEREVLNLIESLIGNNYEVIRRLQDENGLYMLDIKTIDESGDDVVYTYTREGVYPEGFSSETVVDVIFYMGELPVGGRSVAKFVDGVWIKESE